MGDIVTVEQADGHLRLDLDLSASPPADPRYADLAFKITQAEAIILDYLKVAADVFVGSPPAWSTGSPPLWTMRDLSVIQAGVLLVLSALYDDETERTLGDYLKPDGVIALILARLRDPALA
jgi:hypothetical protein